MLIFPIPGLPHNPSGVLQGRVLYKLHTPVSRINVLKDCLRIPFAFAKTTKNQRQWNNNCFHWQECKSDAKEGQDVLLKEREANRANGARGNFFRWPFISAHPLLHQTLYLGFCAYFSKFNSNGVFFTMKLCLPWHLTFTLSQARFLK